VIGPVPGSAGDPGIIWRAPSAEEAAAEPSGAEPSGAEPSGAEPSGAEPSGAEPSEAPARALVPVIRLRGITRIYSTGRLEVAALRGVDLDVMPGDFLAIVGPSGSGKSTLMNIIGCLDRPTSGTYHLAGTAVEDLDDDDLAHVRSRAIGFVFQSFNLLPRTTAIENVATPLLYQGVSRKERHARAAASLQRLGLGDRMDHAPSELSGGQQQRVAIARALVTRPALILADEPTGNLDSTSGADVLALLHELNAGGTTIVLITHDSDVAVAANRMVHVRDGRFVQ
jgi:putative ABC transport system ATP-binding protein